MKTQMLIFVLLKKEVVVLNMMVIEESNFRRQRIQVSLLKKRNPKQQSKERWRKNNQKLTALLDG
jgi:hypothetical protein